MKVITSSSYREGSITAITSQAAAAGQLQAFFTTASLMNASRAVDKIPFLGKRIAKELRRRSFGSNIDAHTRCLAAAQEIIHVSVRRLLPSHPAVNARLMYWMKAEFDSAVAKHVMRSSAEVVIGMWGTCRDTFRHARPLFKVLNYVNSRPKYHNRYLVDLGGASISSSEMIPDLVADRVEEEMLLADLILVPSKFVAEQMPEYRSKVLVAPYGVDTAKFRGDQKTRSAKYPSGFNILFVGQISRRKGIPALLAAARQIAEANFLLAGPIVDPSLLSSLPKNVSYLGKVTHDGVPELMRSADAFVAPSVEDSFSLVTLEAMASELPTIVSSNCGAAEVIADGTEGLVFLAGDVAALVRTIRKVIESRDLQRSMGVNGRRRVERHLTWDQYSKSVLANVEHLIGTQ